MQLAYVQSSKSNDAVAARAVRVQPARTSLYW